MVLGKIKTVKAITKGKQVYLFQKFLHRIKANKLNKTVNFEGFKIFATPNDVIFVHNRSTIY